MLSLVETKRISVLVPATFELLGVAAAYLVEVGLDAKRICSSVGLDRFADIHEIGVTLAMHAVPGGHLLKRLKVFVVKVTQTAGVHWKGSTSVHCHRKRLQETGCRIVAVDKDRSVFCERRFEQFGYPCEIQVPSLVFVHGSVKKNRRPAGWAGPIA